MASYPSINDREHDLWKKILLNSKAMAQNADQFEPSDIPGLGLDLDASYGVLNSIGPDVPATNGQSVRRWLDKSGNGRYHETSNATLQPKFLSAGLNGLPCLSFDGVDDSLVGLVGLDLFANRPGATVCAVAIGNSGAVPSTETLWFASTNQQGFTRMVVTREAGNEYTLSARRDDSDSVQTVIGGVTGLGAFVLSGVVNWFDASATLYLDGAVISSASPFLTPGLSSSVDSVRFQAGRRSNSAPFPGKIARILVWPRALSAPELSKVHAYLSQTYGIPLAP